MARCGHCGISFITDPRNAGRCDLRCPFGCREAHRKQCSTKRSVAYYQTEDGKVKRKIQNDKRKRFESAPEEDKQPEGAEKQSEDATQSEQEKPTEEERSGGAIDGAEFDEGMVSYVRMVTSLIEGRRVSRDEILQMLARSLRQHSISRRRRTDYHIWSLNENPP